MTGLNPERVRTAVKQTHCVSPQCLSFAASSKLCPVFGSGQDLPFAFLLQIRKHLWCLDVAYST